MVTTHPTDYGPEPSTSELQAEIFRLEGECKRLQAALDADPALRDFIRDTPMSEPNDGWATEEQGDGLPLKYTDKDLDNVVERCAKVAEGYPNDAFHGEMIAHSIRALKDKP